VYCRYSLSGYLFKTNAQCYAPIIFMTKERSYLVINIFRRQRHHYHWQEPRFYIFSALLIPTLTSTSVESDKLIPVREFVQCDVTLMKNIQEATCSILTKYTEINYLVMSPGFMVMAERDETEEGIDKKLVVHYCAKWTFLFHLLPPLNKANEAGEMGAVMSVLAAGKGGAIYLEDLALKKGYSVPMASFIAPTCNNLMWK